eukprot:6488101-Amphidinium_carterae.1
MCIRDSSSSWMHPSLPPMKIRPVRLQLAMARTCSQLIGLFAVSHPPNAGIQSKTRYKRKDSSRGPEISAPGENNTNDDKTETATGQKRCCCSLIIVYRV